MLFVTLSLISTVLFFILGTSKLIEDELSVALFALFQLTWSGLYPRNDLNKAAIDLVYYAFAIFGVVVFYLGNSVDRELPTLQRAYDKNISEIEFYKRSLEGHAYLRRDLPRAFQEFKGSAVRALQTLQNEPAQNRKYPNLPEVEKLLSSLTTEQDLLKINDETRAKLPFDLIIAVGDTGLEWDAESVLRELTHYIKNGKDAVFWGETAKESRIEYLEKENADLQEQIDALPKSIFTQTVRRISLLAWPFVLILLASLKIARHNVVALYRDSGRASCLQARRWLRQRFGRLLGGGAGRESGRE